MLSTEKGVEELCADPTQELVLECNLPRPSRLACHGLLVAVNAYQSQYWSSLIPFRHRGTWELQLIACSQRSVAHENGLMTYLLKSSRKGKVVDT